VKVGFRRVATAELREAVAWYNLQQPGLGLELLKAVNATVQGILEHPQRWSVYHRSVRRASLHRFPYVLYYEIRPDNRIRVYRVVHASRDPLPVRDLLP